jgi:hypothetical protein
LVSTTRPAFLFEEENMALKDEAQMDLLKKTISGTHSKYRNKKTVILGEKFASKAEAARYVELKAMEEAGEIKYLVRQPVYRLFGGIRYIADFRYITTDGKTVVEDVKGLETPEFKMKKKLFRDVYKQDIQIIKIPSDVVDALLAAAFHMKR